ncbi:hypothetical protein GRI62_13530 [Erythrobacter arachoides]|uniref:DAGKc domain-containing protein n=1 Tax=Aurantiacibacter arachoides TaxID=1850444 RepID=A0A845A4L7_9SPHN|nr:diacylglycerol kinase family protein [Aurantiacibacter arachoides]MXO94620.1 hypothetical protein [Aurantiacibacter arachoides]GGD62029.1 diacylglycerol kinase [Aurantiacibacter arachoides]
MSELRLWLINNEASGSNDTDALTAFEGHCDTCGLKVAHRTIFPKQELPTVAMLEAAGIETVAVFAGDGTINAVLEALAGWSGAVLVLPGGTMNLLYHRLFGDAEMDEVLGAVARGGARRRRPGIIETASGHAYAGVLAGPGTAWGDVREAMRLKGPLEMAAEARAAIAETLFGSMLRVDKPQMGKREGYPLLLLTPTDEGITVDAYYAETAGDYFDQTLALMRREFRDGPHDRLGQADSFTLASTEHEGFGVLLDGEQCQVDGPTEFRLVRCEVDLLATRDDD